MTYLLYVNNLKWVRKPVFVNKVLLEHRHCGRIEQLQQTLTWEARSAYSWLCGKSFADSWLRTGRASRRCSAGILYLCCYVSVTVRK